MNIFSNIGITELLFILLLALLVVGPERLPELGKKLGHMLRDVRKAYDNLTRDLGPELTSIQQTTRELRESVDSVRSIPKDMVQTVVKAADMDETIGELKEIKQSLGQVGQTLSDAQRAITNPVGAAVNTAKEALRPPKLTEVVEQAGAEPKPVSQETAEAGSVQPSEAEAEPGPMGQEMAEAGSVQPSDVKVAPPAQASESVQGEQADE